MQHELFNSNHPVSDVVSSEPSAPAVELKGSVFTLPILRIKRWDLAAIEADLTERLAQSLRFFENAPVVVDLEALDDDGAQALDFAALCQLLREKSLVPVGVRKADADRQAAAVAAGLAVLKGGSVQSLETTPAPQTTSSSSPADPPHPVKTRVVEQPVRSGQRIYAQGGDLIVLAPVNAGAEVIADGNIHVYAPLRGRALAGVMGDDSARIFAQFMAPELVAIAGHYQVYEEPLPGHLFGKAVQARLDGSQLVLTPLQ